jgi:hypothetical protein
VVGRTRRAEDTAALVTARGLALLLDEDPRDIRARLAPVFEALPGRARVFQVGAMLSRRTDTVRLCIDRLEQAALMELVEQLGGAGPAGAIRDAVQDWSGLAGVLLPGWVLSGESTEAACFSGSAGGERTVYARQACRGVGLPGSLS